MSRSHSAVRNLALSLALPLVWLAAPAQAQSQWIDGSPSRVQHRCVIGTMIDTIEDLSWTWVGFNGLPSTGSVYYSRIVVGGLGCSGVYAKPELKLPRDTVLAIDASHPVRCIWTPATPPQTPVVLTDGSCPVQPGAGQYGSGYLDLGPATQAMWPLAAGAVIEIDVPVISNSVLNGIASNDFLLGAVYLGDPNSGAFLWDAPPLSYNGYGIPSSGAYEGVFVSAGQDRTPRVIYPEPTAVDVTTTTAGTRAHVFTFGCTGQINYEILPVDPNVPDTTVWVPGQPNDCVPNASDSGYDCIARWTKMLPGKQYQWRVTGFTANAGQEARCSTAIVDPGYRYLTTLSDGTPTSYPLVASAETGGSVALNPPGGAYLAGTSVTVTATAEAGYHFTGWRLDQQDLSGPNPYTLTVNASHTIVALFASDNPSGGADGGSSGGAGDGGSGGSAGGGATDGSGQTKGCGCSSGAALFPGLSWLGLALHRRRPLMKRR